MMKSVFEKMSYFIFLGMAMFLSMTFADAKETEEKEADSPIESLTVKQIYERLSKPVMLEGRVEHSDRVPPLDSRFAPGNYFYGFTDNLKPEAEVWVQIPSWLAGVHRTEKTVVMAEMNFRTGSHSEVKREEGAINTFQFGHQMDRNGNIWHLTRLPYRGECDVGDYFQYTTVDASRFLKLEENSVILESGGASISVLKDSKKVQNAAYLEAISKCYPDGKDIITEASTKSFDEKGEPVEWNLSKDRAVFISPFVPDPRTHLSFLRFMFKREHQK